MSSPTPFKPVQVTPRKPRRKGRPTKAQRGLKSDRLTATIGQPTRDRLITEALEHPAYDGMAPEEVTAFVNARLNALVASCPWWYGGLLKDRPKQKATEAQLIALAKAREAKVEIQREADAPYEPIQPHEDLCLASASPSARHSDLPPTHAVA